MRGLVVAVVTVGLSIAAGMPATADSMACQQNGQYTYCTTYPDLSSGQPLDYGRAWGNPTGQAARGTDYVNGLFDRRRQNAEDDARRQAGALVAQGRCLEARQTALSAGNFALAQEIATACPH